MKEETRKRTTERIPLLDLKAQYLSMKAEIDDAIKRVVDGQNFIMGEDVRLLESEVASYCGAKFGIGVSSGTDAIILALRALGIKEGDEVITSPFTFIATAGAISNVGATPVFCDIEPRTYNIDPVGIADKITKRTKAIIPVHLYGQCADMDAILAIARSKNIKVIEDAAQAIGASYKGKKAGSMGDAGCISFFPSKNLGAFGDGGMVVTNDNALADKIATLRVHGSAARYIHSMIGTNARLDNLQAAVVRVKLKYLNPWLEARQKNAQYYAGKLKGLPVACPHTPEYNVHTYHQYTLRIKAEKEKMLKHLSDNGIEARTYYPIPLHLQGCYRFLGYKAGDMKESEAAAQEVFSIPIFPEMTQNQKEFVVDKITEFFG